MKARIFCSTKHIRSSKIIMRPSTLSKLFNSIRRAFTGAIRTNHSILFSKLSLFIFVATKILGTLLFPF